MPVGVISQASTQLIVTFFGLVAASILPTVTLLLNSMTANGRSVKHLNDLRDELQSGVNALFTIFLFVCAAVIALAFYSAPLPKWPIPLPGELPDISLAEVAKRVAQGLVAVFAIMTIVGARKIPQTVQRALELRAEIAVLEAQRATRENAPKKGETAEGFKTKPGFGTTHNLPEIPRGDQ